jgi:Family of unknown function (DUF6515)
MKIPSRKTELALTVILAAALLLPAPAEAQKMKHSPPQGSKASGGANRSINGGAQKSSSRPAPGGSPGNRTNVGNSVNVDNSRRNVNININNSKNINVGNSRNTVVRAGQRPYVRPPYVYGGHRYYCHAPYHYHPYHPYYWGPVWHPWGFFVATLAATAIIVSVANQQYRYDQGVYYVASGGGYTVVPAPVGATVTTLPAGSQTVVVNETTNNYYYGGTYYEKSGGGYTVVAPTAGTVVESLPEGGEEVRIGDVTYVKIGETYYQPIEKDGKGMYEVVQVEADKK